MIATLNCANDAPEKAVIRTASANTRSDNDFSDNERMVEWICISVSFCPIILRLPGTDQRLRVARTEGIRPDRVNSEMLVTAGATAHPLETLVS